MIGRILQRLEAWRDDALYSGSGAMGEYHRPVLNSKGESNIKGVYVIGDLAGAPVIKLAMEAGYNVIEEIARDSKFRTGRLESDDIYDIIVVGAGAAGLNAALAAEEKGFSCLVLEKEQIANTIQNFPEGKWIYAEPDSVPAKGKLWLDGATKEDLVSRWHGIIEDNKLDVRCNEDLKSLSWGNGRDYFNLITTTQDYKASRVIIATGQRGNPRKLGVPGEDQEKVYHRLYSPKKYKDENILVVGGGNSAVEAALTLSEQNKVTLSYRQAEFSRLFKDNQSKLDSAVQSGRIELVLSSEVEEFGEGSATLSVNVKKEESKREVAFDHAFVLIGAEFPIGFLKSLGIRMENDWDGIFWFPALLTLGVLTSLFYFKGSLAGSGSQFLALAAILFVGLFALAQYGNRYSYLGVSFLIWYTIYGAKVGAGEEFWPFEGWGYEALSFFDRPWSFWYTVLYTALMTFFGFAALKRWGLDRKDRFQIWRFVSLISFQWVMFFIIPEYLFQKAVEYQWIGERLASDPQFAEQAWRSYGLVYAWPLFFYTFFYDPHQIWIIWGVLLTFLVIPIVVLFHGKRYCSWVCGCGGLAETFGDRWRHLAPKGKKSIELEWMGTVVLILAFLVTGGMLLRDIIGLLREPAEIGVWIYRIGVDVWLVGILPVTLYPFLGGKVWCRYWCPLAKMMQFTSEFWAKLGKSRFSIEANDKCIACGECTRNCQVGIDVMNFALKQESLDNTNSSCIGCGICVTVCPMDVLSFDDGARGRERLTVVS